MSKETSKAMRRRWIEHESGGFKWKDIFKGKWIDVGSGDDPLPIEWVITFDQQQGDANQLSKYFAPESFDGIHASQVLEHMIDPLKAVADWLKILKKGGHLVITVPDITLYEGMRWPSVYNPDHKSSWSLFFKKSACSQHIYLPDFIDHVQKMGAKIILNKLRDNNYDYKIGTSQDQTLHESDGVEAWIEMVLIKK